MPEPWRGQESDRWSYFRFGGDGAGVSSSSPDRRGQEFCDPGNYHWRQRGLSDGHPWGVQPVAED